MAKLTFDEVMERFADERPIDAADVRADVLRRKVWVTEWHLPGCLSESRSVCIRKTDAIESALMFAESDDGYPRGMKTALQKFGRFDHRTPLYGDVITTVEQCSIKDLL